MAKVKKVKAWGMLSYNGSVVAITSNENLVRSWAECGHKYVTGHFIPTTPKKKARRSHA